MSIQFWRRWLISITGGVMVYGLCLIFFPRMMHRLFNTLFFASENIQSTDYISFVYGC